VELVGDTVGAVPDEIVGEAAVSVEGSAENCTGVALGVSKGKSDGFVSIGVSETSEAGTQRTLKRPLYKHTPVFSTMVVSAMPVHPSWENTSITTTAPSPLQVMVTELAGNPTGAAKHDPVTCVSQVPCSPESQPAFW